MMAKDNETAKFIVSAAVRFSKRMPSVVPLSIIFDQLIVSSPYFVITLKLVTL
ncbi:hypothetical protein RE773_003954 [Salmonella enterica]|nr:hypothetical protein [Salmonella enterica]EKY8871274.1 hypothetical protein [Salmonella enterica]EKY8981771.1 hypothetical protein [Salmonella enterica]EKZ8159711.1 hypothetical protein [Salmonella enterica]ELF2384095.1 hypothetical protein [Salmonella enterica]